MATFISEWGIYGTGNGSLNSPRGIALDQQGNVYVADTANNRIQVLSARAFSYQEAEDLERSMVPLIILKASL